MKILLTSFYQWHEHKPVEGWIAYSVAVYQPHWYTFLPKISGFDIRDDQGGWIRPRNFIGDGHDSTTPSDTVLRKYREALCELYDSRMHQISEDLQNIEHDFTGDGLALCCWCPYDKAAKRQLQDYGSFICHTFAMEHWLQTRGGYQVIRDQDRQKMVRL